MPNTESLATVSRKLPEQPTPTTPPPGGQKGRRGRPRAEEAGQVEARLLDASNALFLRQGFGRTTMDQVCRSAGASKTTVYARYPTKRELFAAVVHHQGELFAARMPTEVEGSLRARLIAVGLVLVREALTPDAVALMRMTCAEAEAFPEVAREGFRIGFGHLVDAVRRTLPTPGTDQDQDQDLQVATRFVELALHPLFMHAFYGADLESLRARAEVDVPAIAAMLAGPALDREAATADDSST